MNIIAKYIIKNLVNLFLILICLIAIPSRAILLESMVEKKHVFQNNKICYFPGSFNIFHKGHEAVVNSLIAQKICNFVLVYPLWDDKNYKNRTRLNIRKEMLFSTFKSNQNVLVTAMPPQKLQEFFTSVDVEKGIVKPILNIRFIGVVGSDNALQSWKSPSEDFQWLGNKVIPLKFYNSSLGTLMAIPADEIAIFIRNNDNVAHIKMLDNKRIIAKIKNVKTTRISATMIKDLYRKSPDLAKNFVNSHVFAIMKKYSKGNL